MKPIFLALVAGLLVLADGASATDVTYLQGLRNTHYHNVESEIIGRGYHVYVMLPDGYENSSDHYPTVYLLDGGGLYPLLTAYYRYLNFGQDVPDSIIVGISYGGSTFEEGNYRSTDYTAPSEERDYWGGAEDFQAFLGDELLPMIESEYRSDESRRVVFGQSIGGQFVLYTAQTRPDLFWGHIASNPALHRNLDFYLQHRDVAVASKDRPKLFVADGTEDDPQFREPALEWMAYWNAQDDPPWELRTIDLDGHNHMSAPPASFRQGMRWLFFE